MTFREIDPKELGGNFIKKIGFDWMLVTAQNSKGKVNTMTAAWGWVGYSWQRPVAVCVIRRSRFTHEFVEDSNTFSLTFFDESYRRQLNLCGKESGRNMDKIKACSFNVLHEGETPYFAQSNLVFICRKVAKQYLGTDAFIDKSFVENYYPEGDFHDMYFGEIVKVLAKE